MKFSLFCCPCPRVSLKCNRPICGVQHPPAGHFCVEINKLACWSAAHRVEVVAVQRLLVLVRSAVLDLGAFDLQPLRENIALGGSDARIGRRVNLGDTRAAREIVGQDKGAPLDLAKDLQPQPLRIADMGGRWGARQRLLAAPAEQAARCHGCGTVRSAAVRGSSSSIQDAVYRRNVIVEWGIGLLLPRRPLRIWSFQTFEAEPALPSGILAFKLSDT